MPAPKNQRDYFAEMYVAGIIADRKWNIYFPRRDQGFDFIITKSIGRSVIVRPVQVKGKYPETKTAVRNAYGYSGKLTQTHEDMILAIPFFSSDGVGVAPTCIAYALWTDIRKNAKGAFVCSPATLKKGIPSPMRDFTHLFDSVGLKRIEKESG
jgi:hypothetical protein